MRVDCVVKSLCRTLLCGHGGLSPCDASATANDRSWHPPTRSPRRHRGRLLGIAGLFLGGHGRRLADARAGAALATLAEFSQVDDERLAAIGFCFGGFGCA